NLQQAGGGDAMNPDFQKLAREAQARFALARHMNPVPAAVRQAVLERAGGRCEDCGEQTALELHHLTYQYCPDGRGDLWTWIVGKVTPRILDDLCRYCHQQRHTDLNGDFWADPEEMAHRCDYYYRELEKD